MEDVFILFNGWFTLTELFTAPRRFHDWLESHSGFVNCTNDGGVFTMSVHVWRSSAIYPDLQGTDGKFHTGNDNRQTWYHFNQLIILLGKFLSFNKLSAIPKAMGKLLQVWVLLFSKK